MSGKKELIFDFDSPVKNSQSLSESQIRPRRSARARNIKEEIAAADGDDIIVNGQEEEAAASSDPKSKNEKKRKRSQQPPSSPAASAERSNNFASIWSEEDEIKILQGIITEKQNGSTPKYDGKNSESLLAVVGSSLSFKATGPQLRSKIRHLKDRYARAPTVKKAKAKGHKKVLYDLSDKIWSSVHVVADDEDPKSYPELKIAVERQGGSYAVADDQDPRSYPELKIAVERQRGYLRFNEVVAALGEDARKLDEEFKKLREKEMELWKQIHEHL